MIRSTHAVPTSPEITGFIGLATGMPNICLSRPGELLPFARHGVRASEPTPDDPCLPMPVATLAPFPLHVPPHAPRRFRFAP